MDMRVLTTFPNHRKTRRLIKVLGYEAVYSLITLWAYTAENHPKGNLNGYDEIEIEESAKWEGKSGLFVETLLDKKTCFLIKTKAGFMIRNWEKHQGWIVNAPERRKKAQVAAAKRWGASGNATGNATSIDLAMQVDSPEQCPYPSPSPSPKPIPIKDSSPAKAAKPTRSVSMVDEALLSALESNPAYTGINIRKEYGKMQAWLLTPKGKDKLPTKQRFVNWLNRATPDDKQKSGGPVWIPEF